jgi:hypothetical protein
MTFEHEAKCYCGKVKFKIITSKKPICGHCHCETCRKWNSSSFFTTCMFSKPTSFEILQGKELIRSVDTGKADRCFCGECGGRVYNKVKTAEVYSIPLAVIEGVTPKNIPSHLKPGAHVCFEEAIIDIPDGKIKFNGMPDGKSLSGIRVFSLLREYFPYLVSFVSVSYIIYKHFTK